MRARMPAAACRGINEAMPHLLRSQAEVKPPLGGRQPRHLEGRRASADARRAWPEDAQARCDHVVPTSWSRHDHCSRTAASNAGSSAAPPRASASASTPTALPSDLTRTTSTRQPRPPPPRPLGWSSCWLPSTPPAPEPSAPCSSMTSTSATGDSRSPGRTRPIDEFSHQILLEWLDYRRTRWPNTATDSHYRQERSC